MSTWHKLNLDAADARELTRESLFAIAQKSRAFSGANEVHIVVTTDCGDGDPVELALVEVRLTAAGWVLQYVSHPARCADITAAVHHASADLAAYVEASAPYRAAQPSGIVNAQVLQDEGCGPYDALDLRPRSVWAMVPSATAAAELQALLAAA